MARASKRDHIVEQATALFLQQGFKGTSVDSVVTTCAVSKPTVYKHFPDKTLLMAAVMDQWLADRPVADLQAVDQDNAWQEMGRFWWRPEHMAMYRLVIAEGWRFPAAAQRFWQEFDQAWQTAAKRWIKTVQPGRIDDWCCAIKAELWVRLLPAF